MSDSPRSGVLQEAVSLIDGDRNAQYGPPTQDFQRTAAVLTALGYYRRDPGGLTVELEPSDVAILVMAVKLSRLMHSRGKRDNWVDLAGYAGCGFECTLEEPPPAEHRSDWDGILSAAYGPTVEATFQAMRDEQPAPESGVLLCSQVHPQQDIYHAEGHPVDTAADLIRRHLPAGGWGHQSVEGWVQSLPADIRESVAIAVSQMLGHATGGNPEIATAAKAAAEVIEELTAERDRLAKNIEEERDNWKAERETVADERDRALVLLQELRDEKFLGGDQSTISNLRSQLAQFAHHAEDNKELRERLQENTADYGRLQRALDASHSNQRTLVEQNHRVTVERDDFKKKFEHELRENMRLTRELADAKAERDAATKKLKTWYPIPDVAGGSITASSYAGEPVDAADA